MKYIIFSVIAVILASALYIIIFTDTDMLQILNRQDASLSGGYFEDTASTSSIINPLVILTVIGFVLIFVLAKHIYEDDMPILDNSSQSRIINRRITILAFIFIIVSYFAYFGLSLKQMGMEISMIAGTGYFLINLLAGGKFREGGTLKIAAVISMLLLLVLSSIGIFTENIPFRTPYFMTKMGSIFGIDFYSGLIFLTVNLAVGLAVSYMMASFIMENDDEQ